MNEDRGISMPPLLEREQELTTLAARAAGIELEWRHGLPYRVGSILKFLWNPLYDRDDAHELETIMRLDVTWMNEGVGVQGVMERFADHEGDAKTARCYAAVRAAAAVGKSMVGR